MVTFTTGIVKFFDRSKGFGFIDPDDGADAVHVSVKNIKGPNRSLRKGVQVEYTTELNENMGKWFASNVTAVNVGGEEENTNPKGKGRRRRKKEEDGNKENREGMENKGKNGSSSYAAAPASDGFKKGGKGKGKKGSSYYATTSDGFKKGGTFRSDGNCADCRTASKEEHKKTNDGKSYCRFFCQFGCHKCKGKRGGPRVWYSVGYKDLDWNSAYDEGWITMMPQCRNCGKSKHVKVEEFSTLEENKAHSSDGPHEVSFCEACKRGICTLALRGYQDNVRNFAC